MQGWRTGIFMNSLNNLSRYLDMEDAHKVKISLSDNDVFKQWSFFAGKFEKKVYS